MTDETQHIEVTLDAMAYGGDALGRHEGRVVFIPYTIPGETVEARVQSDKGRVLFAEGVRLLEASTDRITPACPHFGPGRCGVCQWQHIAPEVQPLLKQDVLADQLERVGNFAASPVRDMLLAPVVWGYAQRQTWHVGPHGELGLPGASGGLMPIETCHIIHPDLLTLHDALDIATDHLTHVELIRGGDGALMVVLRSADDEPPSLALDLPASVNLLLPDNAPVNLAGETHVSYDVNGRSFRVTAGSAFRANVGMLPVLVEAVVAAVGDADSVIDLYAGVGLFGAFVAASAKYVTLVEAFPPAATDADENTADLEHVDLIEGRVEDVLPIAEPYDAAILNPPGDEGVSIEALDALGELAPAVVVYVSANVATCSRDLKRLVQHHGYQLDYVQPLDIAPQTYHVELVARLVRGPA
jgi:23S rRNA (uracil1939-C5)-methyltransferase